MTLKTKFRLNIAGASTSRCWKIEYNIESLGVFVLFLSNLMLSYVCLQVTQFLLRDV